MKAPRKKVPYSKPSKRNPMLDVSTDAARRAKLLEAEKEADARLRAALGNPKDARGKAVAGHIVRTIAANHLVSAPGRSVAEDFGYLANIFLGKLKYRPGYTVSISNLWKSFLHLLESANANFASEIARGYELAFRWYVAGCLSRIVCEYERLPTAVVAVEIWEGTNGRKFVTVQNDGNRREIMPDDSPEPPMLQCAGTMLKEFIAAQDLKQMRQVGFKRFLAEVKSGKRTLSPRSLKHLQEDSLVNVGPLTRPDLEEVRGIFTSWFALLNTSRVRPKA